MQLVSDATNPPSLSPPARTGSRQMQALTPAQRASAVNTLADLLVSREKFILEANAKDLAEAQKNGLAKPLLSRLSLNSAKLKNLSIGLKQIAEDSHKVSELNYWPLCGGVTQQPATQLTS